MQERRNARRRVFKRVAAALLNILRNKTLAGTLRASVRTGFRETEKALALAVEKLQERRCARNILGGVASKKLLFILWRFEGVETHRKTTDSDRCDGSQPTKGTGENGVDCFMTLPHSATLDVACLLRPVPGCRPSTKQSGFRCQDTCPTMRSRSLWRVLPSICIASHGCLD